MLCSFFIPPNLPVQLFLFVSRPCHYRAQRLLIFLINPTRTLKPRLITDERDEQQLEALEKERIELQRDLKAALGGETAAAEKVRFFILHSIHNRLALLGSHIQTWYIQTNNTCT